MVIPIKVLIAAIFTLAAILGKLSEQLDYTPKDNFITAWKAIFSFIIGVAICFWVLALFGKISFASIILGIAFGLIFAIYDFGEIPLRTDNNAATDNLSDKFLLKGKKGVITDIVNGNVYAGKLFETDESVIIHIEGKVNIGDKFTIASMENAQIFAKII